MGIRPVLAWRVSPAAAPVKAIPFVTKPARWPTKSYWRPFRTSATAMVPKNKMNVYAGGAFQFPTTSKPIQKPRRYEWPRCCQPATIALSVVLFLKMTFWLDGNWDSGYPFTRNNFVHSGGLACQAQRCCSSGMPESRLQRVSRSSTLAISATTQFSSPRTELESKSASSSTLAISATTQFSSPRTETRTKQCHPYHDSIIVFRAIYLT